MKLSDIKIILDKRGITTPKIDPNKWKNGFPRKHIRKYLKRDFETLEDWDLYVSEYLLDFVRKNKIEFNDPREIGGKVLSELGVKANNIYKTPPISGLFPNQVIRKDGKAKNGFVECRMCALIGLPSVHPFDWVRMYPDKNGNTYPGECKFFINGRNRLRVRDNYDGCLGNFAEVLVLMAYKHEGLKCTPKKIVVDKYINSNHKCYITGNVPEEYDEEHVYPKIKGFPYVFFTADGREQYNLLRATREINRGKSDKMPEEFFKDSPEILEFARKTLGMDLPEILDDGRNKFSVELVRKHKEKLKKYVTEERSKKHQLAYLNFIEDFTK